MIVARTALTRAVQQPVAARQRRTFINWMVNYPDRIVEYKQAQQAGGRAIYTWLKQPNDKYVNMFGAVLLSYGIVQLVVAHYKLATGKGKME